MTTQTFFNDYASAFLTYSAKKIADFYEVPMTVYSDDRIKQVNKLSEVEDFFQEGIKPYKKRGIAKVIPEVISEGELSKRISICKVYWSNYDKLGHHTSAETNVYILTKTDKGLKINGLVMMTN